LVALREGHCGIGLGCPGQSRNAPPSTQPNEWIPKAAAFGGGPGGKAPWRVSGLHRRRPGAEPPASAGAGLTFLHPIALSPRTASLAHRAALAHLDAIDW